jgi:signal transduction histidine kinase
MQPPATALLSKPDLPYPDAIDTRLVFRIYAWLAITSGVFVYVSPPEYLAAYIQGMGNLSVQAARNLNSSILRAAAAVIVGAGVCAAGFARIDHPIARRRTLMHFAIAHVVFGLLWLIQQSAIFAFPPMVVFVGYLPSTGWAPLMVGAVLLYAAVTAPAAMPMRRLATHDLLSAADVERVDALRSQYEEQIRQAARQEERARLARDLHDAVKQQLFVIQTSAATVETRFDTDVQGAKAAVEQIRTAARDALVEMQVLIEQLQASPRENVGLVEALKKQCEALQFRSGAEVKLTVGQLPPSEALPPGSQQAIFRAAQEGLANVGRHARARHVEVTLETIGDRLELAIRDDGAGFDTGEGRSGMGIRNIASRAGEVGGSFALHSRPGAGTTVRFSVPRLTASTRDYGRMALAWAVVLTVMVAFSAWRHGIVGGVANRPLSLMAIAIVSILVARYAAAYYRLRRRRVST